MPCPAATARFPKLHTLYLVTLFCLGAGLFNCFCFPFSFFPDPESQFGHRKVTIKRSRDVRAQYELLDEIGRWGVGWGGGRRPRKQTSTHACGKSGCLAFIHTHIYFFKFQGQVREGAQVRAQVQRADLRCQVRPLLNQGGQEKCGKRSGEQGYFSDQIRPIFLNYNGISPHSPTRSRS